MAKVKRIAIIPARGGSKRIKNKNIINFFGKPMIFYAINALKKSKFFEKIHVSTDSKKIFNLVERRELKIDFLRSKEKSRDEVGMEEVVKFVINKYKKAKVNFDEIWLVYATNPFIKKKYLYEAYKKYLKYNKQKTVLTVTKFESPIEKALNYKKKLLHPIFPKKIKKRSNFFKPKFVDAGMFVIYQKDYFLKKSKKKIVPYNISNLESVDINDRSDLNRAEKIFKFKKN